MSPICWASILLIRSVVMGLANCAMQAEGCFSEGRPSRRMAMLITGEKRSSLQVYIISGMSSPIGQ